MKFNELSEKDKNYFSVIYRQVGISHTEKVDIISKKFEIAERTVRSWAKNLGIMSNVAEIRESPQIKAASEREIDSDTQIILITAAQNKASVNKDFITSLENYRDYLTQRGYKAQIIVIPIRYRNPTVLREKANNTAEDYWDSVLDPYLYYNKLNFADTLVCADSRVVPTASMPLNGYESLAFQNNLILGHPRIHLKTIPRFKDQKLRTMNTTGFCTVKQYSKSKSGDKAFIHHSYGFTIVEKKSEDLCFKPRCVKVKSDGSFIDIVHRVDKEGVSITDKCLGVVLGDMHHASIDSKKVGKTMELLDKITPGRIILHDLFDGSTVNPHEYKDLYIKKKKIREGRHLIQQEVDETLKFVTQLDKDMPNSTIFVVQSNHDDFLDRFVNDFDWKKDLHNSHTYLKLAEIQQTTDLEYFGNLFGYLLSIKGITYLKNHESHFISDYQVGHHGEYGINGAKGSTNSFKNLNQKMIHGHSHSPTIIDGVTCVGVSCQLWQYYNSKGLSSWAHADSIIHENGKNQLLIYDDDYQISNFI